MEKNYTFNNYTNTFKGNTNKNTLIINNSLPFKHKEPYDQNTIPYQLLTDTSKPKDDDPSNLSKFMRDHFADSLYKNSQISKRHIRSPLDNKLTLETLQALNKPKPPFEPMELIFNDFYKEKNKPEVDRYKYYKEQKELYQSMDINEISNHKILSQIKDDAMKNVEFPVPNKMKKEFYPKIKIQNNLLQEKEKNSQYGNAENKEETDSEDEYKEYNVNKLNNVHPRYKEIVENPVQGEPVGVKPKCKDCKFIKPHEILKMIEEERERNEKRVEIFMNKVNRSVDNMMSRLEKLTRGVIQRESRILKLEENKLMVRPVENSSSNNNNNNNYNSNSNNSNNNKYDDDYENLPKTPIPILNPVLKPKRYERIKSKWKIVKKIALFSLFYYVLLNYTSNRPYRERIFLVREKTKSSDYEILKYFLLGQMTPLFDEFKKIKNKNLAFDENTDKSTLSETFQIINSLIKTFFKCLVNNTLRVGVTKLPKNIIYIIYTYVVDKFYYHQYFLTSFEINRIEFNMKGETVNMSKQQKGMILAFLLVNKIFVQECLLNYKEVFLEEKDILTSSNYLYFGSILHYLVRDAFKYNPVFVKDRINLTNYYRNYHLDDYSRFETAMDKLETDLDYGKLFETKSKLVPETEIQQYFKDNIFFKKQFGDDICTWANELGENICHLWKYRKEFITVDDILNMVAKKKR
jgi:hypothetical protein